MANKGYVNKYAKALFELSLKSNSMGNVRDGLNSLVRVTKSIPEFNHVLFTKNTSKADKKNILSNVLNNRIDALVIELLMILMDNDEVLLFEDIANKYNQLTNLDSKELDVTITSNIEFSSDKLDSIKSNLSEKLNKQINIKTHINKSLLGGVQLRIGNTIIDNSLSNKLIKLRNNLKNNQANMELKNGN